MSYAVVMGFQKEFEMINLDMMKNDVEKYDLAILVAYTLETERGFIVKKQGKTTKKGTKFTYKACKDEAEAKEYSLKLHELLKQHNEKYKTNAGSYTQFINKMCPSWAHFRKRGEEESGI